MGKRAGGVARATKSDVLSGVAKRTDFTIAQVDEVFSAYREIVDEIVDAGNRPVDFEMCIPYIGYFVFQRVDRYKINGMLSRKNETVMEDMSGKWVEAYDRIRVRVDKGISIPLKLKSRAKILKKKELEEKFGEKE